MVVAPSPALPTARPSATVAPTPSPTVPADLLRLPAGSLLHPLAAAIAGDTIYAVDSGRLKAISLPGGQIRTIEPPNNTVAAHPVQEITSLAYFEPARILYLLDRSGAVYGWDMGNTWTLEREAGGDSSSGQEYPVALAADATAVYLLDTNNGRIWRKGSGAWQALITNSALEGAIRLAPAAGDLFILVGERPGQPARLFRLRGAALSGLSVPGGLELPSQVAGGLPEGRLLVIDQGLRRVRLVQAGQDGGAVLDADPLTLPNAANDVHVAAYGGQGIILLGRDYVYKVAPAGRLLAQPLAAGAIAMPAALARPNDLILLAGLPALRMPIPGAHLPTIDRSLPGSPRPYRFGIHEGLDMYGVTVGASVVEGTRVFAAGDGVVTRADVDYMEHSPADMARWLAETQQRRMTPPETENRLGGRQVWIDHGNGFSTRYLHLSGIAPTIKAGSQVKAGDLIAFAGNSGTPEAAAGAVSDVHLHFEVRVGDTFLGQWLAPIETRRLLARVLGVP